MDPLRLTADYKPSWLLTYPQVFRRNRARIRVKTTLYQAMTMLDSSQSESVIGVFRPPPCHCWQSPVHPLIRRRKSQHGEWTRTDLWFIFSRHSAQFGPLETPIPRYICHCILPSQWTESDSLFRLALVSTSPCLKSASRCLALVLTFACYLAIVLVSSPSSLRLRLRHPRIVLVGTAFPPTPVPPRAPSLTSPSNGI